MVEPKKKKATKKKTTKEGEKEDSSSETELNKENEPTNFITVTQFEELLRKQLAPLEKTLNEALTRIQADIDAVKSVADNAHKLADKAFKQAEANKIAIAKLTEDNNKTIDLLKKENATLKNQIHDAVDQNSTLDERIENRTNRQLRKTLVFKGIPEKINDTNDNQHKNETWDDTEEILASRIAEVCDMQLPEAKKLIERCHRSNPNPKYKGSGPRPIFAAFHSWKDSEWVKNDFRKNNIDNPRCHIYAEQKFGPKTTMRRNQAMLMRKSLKEKGDIINGYVAYPARLMVKTSNERGAKYILKKDFSKEEVNFDR